MLYYYIIQTLVFIIDLFHASFGNIIIPIKIINIAEMLKIYKILNLKCIT